DKNKPIQAILKNLSFKANKHGDIAIVYFLKSSSKSCLVPKFLNTLIHAICSFPFSTHTEQIISQSSYLSPEIIDSELVEFLDFLLRFYELKFLQDIYLLHI